LILALRFIYLFVYFVDKLVVLEIMLSTVELIVHVAHCYLTWQTGAE